MDKAALQTLLSSSLPGELAVDLTEQFIELRQDVATQTLGKTSAGKFVETLVQVLQFMESGEYDAKPKVDDFLRSAETKAPKLDDGLRICAARIGRAAYSLRNKRNIAHKGSVDPNGYDLQFQFGAAQWILAEIVRIVDTDSMSEAGKLVDQIHAPVGGLVEDFGNKALVLADLSVPDEVLVLLHHRYPDSMSTSQVTNSIDRRSSGAVRKALRQLWRDKLVEGGGTEGYRLTKRGFDTAIGVVGNCIGS